MYPKPIQRVIDLLMKLPGVGPRQAARFVFFMLKEQNGFIEELATGLNELKEKIATCTQCYRMMEKQPEDLASLCTLCRDARRNVNLITVLEKESDLQNLERTGAYQGLYHVLGGVISPLDSESPKRLHIREMYNRVATLLNQQMSVELILGTNPTTEGDMTAIYIERTFAPIKEKNPNFKLSRLGRGLSLGAELEYADEVTLKNALINRK
ncbi:MAG: recombination mediator RecR [bacterium]|nr:recombination mediator RecR [bacterium]